MNVHYGLVFTWYFLELFGVNLKFEVVVIGLSCHDHKKTTKNPSIDHIYIKKLNLQNIDTDKQIENKLYDYIAKVYPSSVFIIIVNLYENIF